MLGKFRFSTIPNLEPRSLWADETILPSRLSFLWPGFVFLLWASPVFPNCKSSPRKQLFQRLPNHFHWRVSRSDSKLRQVSQCLAQTASVHPLHPLQPSPPRLVRESPSTPILLFISAETPKQIDAWGTCPLFHRILWDLSESEFMFKLST